MAHDTLCEGSGRRVAIVQRIPKVCPEIMREAYIAALDAAERKVQIINPYLLLPVKSEMPSNGRLNGEFG